MRRAATEGRGGFGQRLTRNEQNRIMRVKNTAKRYSDNIQRSVNLSDDNRIDAEYRGTKRANGENIASASNGDRAVSRRTYMGLNGG